MSREIKFRIWNLASEQMSKPFYINERVNQVFNTDTILLQFTGLKDKNEIDIYEGDIITDNATVFKIVFYKGRFDFRRISGDFYCPYFGDNCSRMQIINNIYEIKL